MSTFVWVVLCFSVIDIVVKLAILGLDVGEKRDKLAQGLGICANLAMAGWATVLLARAA